MLPQFGCMVPVVAPCEASFAESVTIFAFGSFGFALKADTARLCADVSGNRIKGAWGIALTRRGSATIALAGMTGTDGSQYLREKNHGAEVIMAGAPTAVKSCL